MIEFTREEKREILGNEKVYPELARLIKHQNKYKFEMESDKNAHSRG